MTRSWYHVRPFGREALHCIELPSPRENGAAVAMLDPYYGGVSRSTPLSKLVADLPAATAGADALVFRGVSRDDLGENGALAERIRDLRGVLPEVGLIERSDDGKRLRYVPWGGHTHGIGSDLVALRQLEVQAQLVRSSAVHEPPDFHFALPTGFHVRAFIRAADMFDDSTAVERVADWLADRVDSDTILLADSWTIMPLMQELRLRQGEAGVRGMIHSFPEYPDVGMIREMLQRLRAVGTATGAPGKVLFIMSVAASGTLARRTRAMWEAAQEARALELVSVVSTMASGDVEALCHVPAIERFAPEACPFCRGTECPATVGVDRRRYLPEVSTHRVHQMITPDSATRHRAFWEHCDRTESVLVHSDLFSDANEGAGTPATHRTVAIDVVRLLRDESARDHALDRLAGFASRCDLVVSPQHHATDTLFTLAQALYPDVQKIALRAPFQRDGREQLQGSLKGKRRILILDDAVVTGRATRAIHRLLQDYIHELPSEEAPRQDYQIAAFAVVGRPNSESQWTRLVDSLRQEGRRSFLDSAWRVLIPNDPCPWCEEQSELAQVVQRLRGATRGGREPAEDEVIGLLEARLGILDRRSEGGRIRGLRRSLFLCDAAGSVRDRESDRLTYHSLFGEGLHEAATYGAVATAMHDVRLRVENDLLTGRSVLTWDWALDRLFTAYHDPLIQASFLRAAHRDELRVPLTREILAAIGEAFHAIGTDGHAISPMLAAEHAWAALSGKYPVPLRDALLKKSFAALSSRLGGNPDASLRVSELLTGVRRHLLVEPLV